METRNGGNGRAWLALLLTGLFVGLRLSGVTDWQWYWVFAPQWGALILEMMLGEDDGGSFPLLLTGLFFGLRLGGVIHWWWWWIFAPLWLPAGIALVSMTVFVGTALIIVARDHWS